jgi:hypothetical protein
MTQDDHSSTAESLPSKADFNPWGPNALDAEWAWGNFGGLTMADAHTKFRERPDIYQEDFMFMGGKAFAFYFPVIEDFLHDVPDVENEGDDHQSWILAKCIQSQFDARTSSHVVHLADRVIALSRYVRKNIRRFGYDDAERARITEVWQELEDHVGRSKANRQSCPIAGNPGAG